MTRIGKQKVIVPNGVSVTINGQEVNVKGPKGELRNIFHRRILFNIVGNEVSVDVKKREEKKSRELWGLSRVLLRNMVEGVVNGYAKKLEINGVGYRAVVSGKKLVLTVGFSHPVEVVMPEGIEVKVEKNIITISGIDKQKVGQIAAQIRDIKKPEPYKGKGIRYIDEIVRRKAGKVMKTAGAA